MRVLGDVITSLYNFRHIGKTLSKRPVGMVAGSFTILVVIYVLVFGLWYSSMFGKFIGIMFDKAKPMMPTFSIVGGRLQMHSSEPYIITHVEFVQLVHESILEMSKQTSDVKLAGDITEGLTEQKIRQQMRPDQTFCFVMDTTGQWKDRVNLDHYTQYAVITKDTMERVDRVKSMPGNIKPISETIKQDIKFIPDLVDRLKLPLNRISTIAIIVGLGLYTPARFLIKALISAFLVWLVLLMAKKQKPFGIIYKISLYSLTPIILLAIISNFWFTIHGLILQAVYFAVIAAAVTALSKQEGSSAQAK